MEILEVSLYKTCLRKVYGLVEAGTWNSCSINPFLNFPSKIINDLMKSSRPDFQKTSDVHLLLTSGCLTHLYVHPYGLLEETDLFLKIIQTHCFKSLQFLHWHSSDVKDIPVIETLIRTCPKLEEFHSDMLVTFEIFLNCDELKVLSFNVMYDFSDILEVTLTDLSVLTSLKNLQVFSIPYLGSNTLAKVLMYCPYLLSVGNNDSLDALSKTHAGLKANSERDINGISNIFQLKKCVWGRKFHPGIVHISYQSEFSEKIRTAVSVCPFVEELTIYVHHTNSIESLKNVKHLTILKINFDECDDDYMKKFLSLLKVIGPNLKYLVVDAQHPVPIDMICEYCPRLNKLELAGLATVSRSDLPPCHLSLKNLQVKIIDRNALLFLLSSCKSLVELFLCDVMCLDDDALNCILRLNPLAELNIFSVAESSLTERGFRMLLERAVSLKSISVSPFSDAADIVEDLITDMNLTNVICTDIFEEPDSDLLFIPPIFL